MFLLQKSEPRFRGFRNRVGIPNRRFTPVLDVFDHGLHPILNRNYLFPATFGLDSGNVGPRAVRLPGTLRDIDTRAPEQVCQTIYRLRIARTEIVDSIRALGESGSIEGTRDVRDVEKVAGLRAIANDCQRLACELLRQK